MRYEYIIVYTVVLLSYEHDRYKSLIKSYIVTMLPSIVLGIFTLTTVVLFIMSRSGYVLWFLNSYEDMVIVHIVNFACLAAAIIYYAIKQPKKYIFNSKKQGDILQAHDEYDKKLRDMAQSAKTLVLSDEQFVALVDKKSVECSDSRHIASLSRCEEGCIVTVRPEHDPDHSIEAKVSRIDDRSIRLEII